MARIAIDLHGGDFGPSVTIPSSLEFFRNHPQHYGVLVGDKRQYRHFLKGSPVNVEWVDAEILGSGSHKPSLLLRREGFSSIEIAYKMAGNQDVDIIVSAEHTGVLMVLLAKYGTLHSLVERPVLSTWLPTANKKTLMLDLGASFNANHIQLLTYAAIGMGMLKGAVNRPSLALLNVGTEYFKGPTELRLAHSKLLQMKGINYQGFVEASEVFNGKLDLIVCDGFIGNSVIKASEGALNLALAAIKKQFSDSWWSRLAGLLVQNRLKQALEPLDPSSANGALLAGSNLAVVKSHGNAQSAAFYSSIERAVQLHNQNAVANVLNALDFLLDEDLEQL